MRLIGITGLKTAGKTTAATMMKDVIQARWGIKDVCVISYGEILKEIIVRAGLATQEEITTKPPHVRLLLQRIGTDLIRYQVDKDFWIKKMRDRLQDASGIVIIDDVRFKNEAEQVWRYNGLMWRIVRNSAEDGDTHPSEVEQKEIPCSVTIMNNGSLEDLRAIVEYEIATLGGVNGK